MKRLAIILILFTSPVVAQTVCGDRTASLAALADKYQEERQSIALDAKGNLIEMFADREDGSWTATITYPNGKMCVLSFGYGYESISEGKKIGEAL